MNGFMRLQVPILFLNFQDLAWPALCMRRPENSWTRVLVWMALGVEGIALPVLHLLYFEGLRKTIDIYGHIIPAYGPIAFGAVIYASQFPECCFPGRFDYIGASHNILHLASFCAIWMGIDALKSQYQVVVAGS